MEPVAFLSYAHLDDAGTTKELSLFHDRLQSELRIQTGLPVHIFFDKKSIGWGKRWAEFISRGLESAAFLIPILTPAFFQSKECRTEYVKFEKTEKRIGRRDLILPIYYVKCREIEYRSDTDALIDDILSRQYRDWRILRHKPKESTEILQEFAELASVISETFFEIKEISTLDQESKIKHIDKAFQTIKYIDQLLGRPITYENMIAYSVEVFPRLPVSPQWTREMLKDIDVDRYKSVRDIDKEVKYAKSKVDEYAEKRPDLFRYSTDFITKSLIFVDSSFREAHTISPETMNAAIHAGITRY